MSALRAPEPEKEFQRPDNTIYVLPPWAVSDKASGSRRRKEGWFQDLKYRWEGSRFAEIVALELKLVAAIVVLGGLTYFGMRGAYSAKNKAGINTVPGVHGGNWLPFLR